MDHFNGHMLCAVDIETTGLKWGYHDTIEICVMPVNWQFEMDTTIPYFHMSMQPRYGNYDENVNGMRRKFDDATSNGIESWTAEERFREWFEKLPLANKKKIVPIGCNYANFDRNFIMDWLGGPLSYEEYFRSDSRDVQQAALFMNDMFAWHNQRVPFPKVSLEYLCSCVGYKNERFHDAVNDCNTTIEVYRRMMRLKDTWSPV